MYAGESDGDENNDDGDPLLRLIVEGTYWTPHHRVSVGGIEYPIRGTANVTADRSPPMADADLRIILTHPALRHAVGGYYSQNADGTYYHEDPMHIRHEPSWQWKDERYAHINFTIDRHHAQMPLDDNAHCDGASGWQTMGDPAGAPSCNYTLALTNPAWLDETLWYGNGDGSSMYVADTTFAFGNYSYMFDMYAYNLGKQVANATNTTHAVLVPYDPQYAAPHSYVVLRDGAEYAFDDRRGLALKYLGSRGADGHTIHTDRRSLINGWQQLGQAHDTFGIPQYSPRPHLLDEARSEPAGTAALEYGPRAADMRRANADGNPAPYDTYISEPRPIHAGVGSNNNNNVTSTSVAATADAITTATHWSQTAMFVGAGYGALLFDWPSTEFMFSYGDQITIPNSNSSLFWQYQQQQQQQQSPVDDDDDYDDYANTTTTHNTIAPPASYSTQGDARHENLTSYLSLRSHQFAGIPDTALTEDTLRYPEMPFGKQLRIESVGPPDGRLITGDRLTLEVTPMQTADIRADWMSDYIRDKTYADAAGDLMYVGITLNDTHGMRQVHSTDTGGVLDVWLLRTSVWFGDESDIIPDADNGTKGTNTTSSTTAATPTVVTLTGDSGNNTNSSTTVNNNTHSIITNNDTLTVFRPLTASDFADLADSAQTTSLRLRAPIDLGLSVPPPTTLRIGLNDAAGQWTINHTYYAFGGSETITINAATDNAADAARVAPSSIHIYQQPEWFGAITAVWVNGTHTKIPCAAGCMLTGLSGTDATYNVTIHNMWGGAAHAMLPPHPASAAVAPDITDSIHEVDLRVFAILLAVVIMGWVVVRLMFGKGSGI